MCSKVSGCKIVSVRVQWSPDRVFINYIHQGNIFFQFHFKENIRRLVCLIIEKFAKQDFALNELCKKALDSVHNGIWLS